MLRILRPAWAANRRRRIVFPWSRPMFYKEGLMFKVGFRSRSTLTYGCSKQSKLLLRESFFGLGVTTFPFRRALGKGVGDFLRKQTPTLTRVGPGLPFYPKVYKINKETKYPSIYFGFWSGIPGLRKSLMGLLGGAWWDERRNERKKEGLS